MNDVLNRVRELHPLIGEQAGVGERDCSVTAEVMAALTEAGCFRMAVTADRKGVELPLPESLAVTEAIARADASTGWVVAVTSTAHLIFAYLPASALDRVYADGPDVKGAGAIAPKGTAVREDGGWRVSGRWPFVSGCRHASWIYVQCVVQEDNTRLLSGPPATRTAVFPVSKVTIEDTWDAVGLRGTGSHDIVVTDAWCPEEFTCAIFDDSPTVDHPLYAIPLLDQLGMFLTAAALGNARGAIDESAALAASGKRPAFHPRRLSKSSSFRERLGEAFLSLEAARSLVFAQAESAWRTAVEGATWAELERATLRATTAAGIQTCIRVADTAYNLGGGSSVYARSPLQRRLRDAHTMGQHAVAGRTPYEIVGAVLAGEDVSSMLF